MKTKKFPQSAWHDDQAAGSQSQSFNQSNLYYATCDKKKQIGRASNDDIYKNALEKDSLEKTSLEKVFADDVFTSTTVKSSINSDYRKASNKKNLDKNALNNKTSDQAESASTATEYSSNALIANKVFTISQASLNISGENRVVLKPHTQQNELTSASISAQIPERVFMNGLIKHTAIALAIIIPLAAFSAYAAPQNLPMNTMPKSNVINSSQVSSTQMPVIEPSSIIHNSASKPTTVDSVDFEQYAGTWYEIGRLPMYFQRKCASDVTATYTRRVNGSGIDVLNQCRKEDGTMMSASGLAKAFDSSGSKLKVTFLPSWIRWLPVGRADYWVLARDANYQTALVGTPDKKYLWLLARTPNISQQTYSKYRHIAQQQGYDLREFKLTMQNNQYVKLVP